MVRRESARSRHGSRPRAPGAHADAAVFDYVELSVANNAAAVAALWSIRDAWPWTAL